MISVSISLGNIKMCSVSATPDLGVGNDEVNARNPPDADPCVAKCIIFADLNRYKMFCLVACSLNTAVVPRILATLKASSSANGSLPKFH